MDVQGRRPPAGRRPVPRDVSCGEWLEKVESNGVVEGVRVHVFNYNHDERVIFFPNVDVTAQQVCEEMATLEQVKDESFDVFSLWIVGDELELQYRPNDDLFHLVEKFPRFVQKYTHKNLSIVSWRFYYKREACVSLVRERKVKDPAAIRLLYYEAAFNVQQSRYPLRSEDEAFTLAGMRMQLLHGDHDPSIHFPGFLTSPSVSRLEEVLPRKMIHRPRPRIALPIPIASARPQRFADYEARIFAEHAKHRGKPRMIMQLLYLQLVRQWPYYGATFFSACTTVPPMGFFEYRDHTLQLGVSAEGIFVIDNDNNRILANLKYDDINWDIQKNALTIEYGPTDAPVAMVLITPQARMVASIIAHAIKLLDENDAWMEQLRQQQAQALRGEGQQRRA